jgi:uncharacterized protein (TIGR00255 family)
MPRSMTGYGAARSRNRRIAVEVEARSVNSRSLKVSFRTPAVLSAREADLEALVRKQVARGSVSLGVKVQFLRPEDVVRVHGEVVEGFAKAIEALRKKGLVEGPLTAEAVAALPGALESAAEAPLKDDDWRTVKASVESALKALDAMRAREAGHLVRDLRAVGRRMRKNLAVVGKRAPEVVKEYARRLKERVDALLANGATLDETTLAREVAVYAERSDVAEEVTRLSAHLDEFERYLGTEGEIGRTLDFLAQEMLRETNTIGSKSQDVEIARAVISLKSDVDRLKEQVQNLE